MDIEESGLRWLITSLFGLVGLTYTSITFFSSREKERERKLLAMEDRIEEQIRNFQESYVRKSEHELQLKNISDSLDEVRDGLKEVKDGMKSIQENMQTQLQKARQETIEVLQKFVDRLPPPG